MFPLRQLFISTIQTNPCQYHTLNTDRRFTHFNTMWGLLRSVCCLNINLNPKVALNKTVWIHWKVRKSCTSLQKTHCWLFLYLRSCLFSICFIGNALKPTKFFLQSQWGQRFLMIRVCSIRKNNLLFCFKNSFLVT